MADSTRTELPAPAARPATLTAVAPLAAEPRLLWRMTFLVLGIIIPQAILFWPSLIGETILLPLDILQQGTICLPVPLEWQPFTPTNGIFSDEIQVLEPWRRFAVDEVRAGRLPLWNPSNYCGAPFLAANQSALFSPFRVLDYLFPGTLIIAWVQVVKSLVAGIGAYLFFRHALRVNFWPALIGGCVFPLTSFLIQWRGYPLSHVVAWLPWVMLGTNWAVRRPFHWGGPLLALATAMLLLCGHIAMAAQVLIGAGLYAGWCLLETYADRRSFTVRGIGLLLASLVTVSGGWGVGFLLAMPQILPTAEYMRASDRVSARMRGYEESKPVGPSSILQLAVPDIYGSEARGTGYLVTGWNRLESAAAGYAGLLIALVFAPISLINRRYQWQGLFWLALALFAASQVLDMPVIREVFRVYPFNVLRNNRLVFLTGWSILTLGVLGLETLWTDQVRWRAWCWLLMAPVVGLGGYCLFRRFVPPDIVEQAHGMELYGWFMRTYEVGLLFSAIGVVVWLAIRQGAIGARQLPSLGILVVAELVWFAFGYNPQCPPELYYPDLPVFKAVRNAPPARVCGEWCLPPAINMMYSLREIRGYDGVDPLYYIELIDCFRVNFPESPRVPYAATCYIVPGSSSLLDMLNLRWVIYRGEVPPDFKTYFRDKESDYYVLENPGCLPRAFVPRQVRTIADRSERLQALTDPNFDAREVAIVEREVGLPGPARGAADVTELSTDELDVAYDLETDGLVVLSDLWDPGWKAYRNGLSLPILKTNHALRGVAVSAGRGVLQFRYEPESFYDGLRWCAVGAGLLVLWLLAVGVTSWIARRALNLPPAVHV